MIDNTNACAQLQLRLLLEPPLYVTVFSMHGGGGGYRVGCISCYCDTCSNDRSVEVTIATGESVKCIDRIDKYRLGETTAKSIKNRYDA